MTGVLAGYEDATGADVRRCRRFVGTSAGSIRRVEPRGGPLTTPAGVGQGRCHPPGRGPRWCPLAVRRSTIGRGDRCRTSWSAPERSPPGSARRSAPQPLRALQGDRLHRARDAGHHGRRRRGPASGLDTPGTPAPARGCELLQLTQPGTLDTPAPCVTSGRLDRRGAHARSRRAASAPAGARVDDRNRGRKRARTGARGRTSLDRPGVAERTPPPPGRPSGMRACERTTGRRRPPPRHRAARFRRPAGGAMVVLNQQLAPRRGRRDDPIGLLIE